MATQVRDHINQWLHNRKFLECIAPDYTDWIVTAAFYAALHAVDALLLEDKVSVTSHDMRNRILSQTNRYKKINSAYYPLYDLSRTIRYIADQTRWIPFDKIESDVFRRFLYPIEKSVLTLADFKLALPKVQLRHSPTAATATPQTVAAAPSSAIPPPPSPAP